MKKINRDEISEEIVYVWTCPECGSISDSKDDPDYEETMYCEHCNEVFEIVQD